jgi:O-antigen ligase
MNLLQAVAHGESRPWLLGGMTALFVARPLFPSESAANYGDGLTTVMLWIALLVFWLLGAVGRPKFTLRFGWTDAAVLSLVLWHTVAALWAVWHGAPRPALNMLWEWVGLWLCFFLARQLIVTAREARAMAAVMIALAVAVSGYGFYQRAYVFPRNRADYQADPDQTLRDNGLWSPPNSPERKRFEDRLANTEPTATFVLTNSLAGFLAPWLVVLAGMIGGAVRERKRLAGMLVLLVPIAACLLWTKSRSGYAGACVGLLLVWLLCRERRIRIGWKLPAAAIGVATLLVAAAIAVEGPAVLGRASKSFGYRLQYWQSSLQMIADHPWLGCGPGNFQDVYTQYKLPEASEEIADPHNFLLEIWATAGTPAALAFLGVLGCFVWSVASGQWSVVSDEQIPKSPNPQIPKSPPDAWLYVLLGGLAGLLLSLPLGTLSAAPPGIAPLLLGLPLAAAAVAVLLGWIREGRLPSWLPAVGVVVVLVDLTAAGGIGLPSVAGTFWLLLALGLQNERPRTQRAPTAWIALAGAVGLIMACYVTAYRPVVECRTQLYLAERAPTRAIERLEAATAADPLSVEAWQRLAAARFDAWRLSPSREAFDRFEQAAAESLRLAPNSAAAWAASGDWYSLVSSTSQPGGQQTAGGAIAKAAAAYAQAVRLYPTSALNWAKLAEAHAAAGDLPAFRREAEAALRLDAATPHADKKLPEDLRKKLARDLGRRP